MKRKIRIAIADDEELFRKGMIFLLEKAENFEVLFEVENGQQLITKLDSTEVAPDIILMDLKMPVLNGVEATKLIHKKFPDIRIIALTSYGGKSFIINMIDVGASSYLLKNTSPRKWFTPLMRYTTKGFITMRK